MERTVVGLFDHREDAQNALASLREAGFAHGDTSIVSAEKPEPVDLSSRMQKSIGAGAAVGAGLGFVAGLMIPGVGPILVAGPILSALGGLGVGALAGGFVAALTEAGIPADRAPFYADEIRRGRTLVAVRVHENQQQRAAEILARHQATDVEARESVQRDHDQPPAG